jgi:ribosomal protein L22
MESTTFEVRAIVKYVPMSPRKVRLVVNQVREGSGQAGG